MDLLHAFWLALIQGITEFLPISSSAHLILPSQVLGWPDQGLAFDAIVNLGTLAAVLIYFRQDVVDILVAWGRSLAGHQSDNGRLGWLLILGTIPVGLSGLLFNDFIETHFRSAAVVATTTLLFGLLLWWADARPSEKRGITDLTWQLVLFIGIAQALALIPGTSRSGVTITAALLVGLNRVAAARFSFLLAIPVGALAGGYEALGLIGNPEPVNWMALGTALVVAFVSAYLCIHYFLKMISKMGMLPFVIYRMILAGLLFAFIV